MTAWRLRGGGPGWLAASGTALTGSGLTGSGQGVSGRSGFARSGSARSERFRSCSGAGAGPRASRSCWWPPARRPTPRYLRMCAPGRLPGAPARLARMRGPAHPVRPALGGGCP